jgi:hypothetical protein
MGCSSSIPWEPLLNFFTFFTVGIAAGTSLLIFPLTSRQVVFDDMRKSISGFRDALAANLTYLHSLEDTDMFAAQRTRTDGDKPARSPEAEAFVAKVQALGVTNAKMVSRPNILSRSVVYVKGYRAPRPPLSK